MYTGSCASQICFTDSITNATARIQRYTHRGPGTVILVENSENGTMTSGDTSNSGGLPLTIVKGGEQCFRNGEDLLNSVAKNCSLGPIADGREDATQQEQCRVACNDFDYSPYEVVRIFNSSCTFCSTSDAEEWFTPAPVDEKHICVPRQVCIDVCGPEGYGCVYSGSCRSRICFSGIDSKKPAVFTTLSDDGKESELFVDNSGGPVDADPPVFGPLGKEGDATSVPSATLSPSPSPTPSPSASSSANSSTTPPPGPATSGGRVWVWVGPVIGVGVVGVIVAAGLVAFFYAQKTSPT